MAKSKGKVTEQAQWHANFRVIDTLPDTKLIRTDFMFTFVAVTLAVVLLFLFCFREYKSINLGREIAKLNNDIELNTADNKSYLRLDGQFNLLSKKVYELESFRYNPYPPSDILLALTEIRSVEIVISHVVLRKVNIGEGRNPIQGSHVSLFGTLTESSEQATQIVSDYVNKLESLKLFSEYIVNKVQLESFNRDEELGSFEFSISFNLNPKKS